MAGKKYDPRLRLVDVHARAVALFGAESVAELRAVTGQDPVDHDWRFEIDTPTGGSTTFNRHATAEYVAHYIATETKAGRV
jgi:hypothetical protein